MVSYRWPMFDLSVCEVDRSELYFKHWEYAVRFYLPHASFLRELDHEQINISVAYRNTWKHYRASPNISESQHEILHKACDFFLGRSVPFKKMVSGHSMWIYTNQPQDFAQLNSIPTGEVRKVSRARITLPSNVIILTNPQHSFRTFFKERWLTTDIVARLRRYFECRPNQFRLSPGMTKFVSGSRAWMAANYFVDHDEPNADFLINMAVPGVVRKTLPIVARTK